MIFLDLSPSGTFMAIGAVAGAMTTAAVMTWRRRHLARGSEGDVPPGAGPAIERVSAAVLTALCDGLLVIDDQDRIVDLSAGAVVLLDLDPAVTRGLGVESLLPGFPPRAEVDATPAPRDGDGILLRCRRGSGRLIHLRARVIDTGEGPEALRIVTLRDASAQVLADGVQALTARLDALLAQGASLPVIASEVCARVARLLDIPLVWLGIPDDGAVRPLGWGGGSLASAPLGEPPADEIDEGPARAALRLGRAVRASGPAAVAWAQEESDIEDVLCLPIALQHERVGVLCLGWNDASPPWAVPETTLHDLTRRLGDAFSLSRDRETQRLRDLAMGAVASAIFVCDGQGRIEWVNDAFQRLSGYHARELQGRLPDVLTLGGQEDNDADQVWAALRAGRTWRGELIERRKDGRTYVVTQSLTPVLDKAGRVVHVVAVHEDVTARKRTEERIRQLVNYDTLTRLPNRVLFRDRLDQAVHQARRANNGLAVLFIDLDHFSRVNDTLGHAVGDLFLMTIASRINAAAEKADTVARLGGDEFALIQTGVSSPDAAAAVARHLIDVIRTPVDLGNHEVRVGANVGIAIFPQDGTDPATLMKNADMALYRAKRSEDEHCLFFSQEMNVEAAARLSLEGDLRRALSAEDQLQVYFQVQYDVRTGRPSGAEALVRWTHPTLGPIPASTIIAVAEDSDLIHDLGDWVLRTALAHYASWRARGCERLLIAVNISAVQFRKPGLLERVTALLAEHGVPADDIELELTESMLMQDVNQAIVLLEAFSRAGIRLAIDDFGTGYSSLSYLKRFRVDRLKVDQSFVRNVTEGGNDAVIARAIINLGHSLGLEVIAEGVETQAQYAYLGSVGCDAVQGFLLARPQPSEQVFEALMALPRD